MLRGKKKESVLFFAGILVVYLALLSYLFFFNTGLELVHETSSLGEPRVWVENSSIHLIRDVKLSVFAEGTKIKEIKLGDLLPGKRKEILFEGIDNVQRIDLLVEAPFHLSLSKSVSFGKRISVHLKPEIRAATITGQGSTFMLELGVCNLGDNLLKNILIEERHPQEFFEERSREDVLSIAPMECRTLYYALNSKEKGQAVIIFNISVLTYKEKIEWDVEII